MWTINFLSGFDISLFSLWESLKILLLPAFLSQ